MTGVIFDKFLSNSRDTQGIKISLSVGEILSVKWWVDTSYTVNEDLQEKPRAIISLEKITVSKLSTKQKMNGKSSTENKIIRGDEAMTKVLWSKHFTEAQGYNIAHNTLLQDNKSAVIFEKYGKWSSSKQTKHTKTSYFLWLIEWQPLS